MIGIGNRQSYFVARHFQTSISQWPWCSNEYRKTFLVLLLSLPLLLHSIQTCVVYQLETKILTSLKNSRTKNQKPLFFWPEPNTLLLAAIEAPAAPLFESHTESNVEQLLILLEAY